MGRNSRQRTQQVQRVEWLQGLAQSVNSQSGGNALQRRESEVGNPS